MKHEIAAAFGVNQQWLELHLRTAHHQLGLWNCKDDGFYRYVYTQTRAKEGSNWLTNDRTGQQIIDWWQDYQRTRKPNGKAQNTDQTRSGPAV